MASAHAVLDFAAQWLGMNVLAVAGTSHLPGCLQFSNYKPWMRAPLALLVAGLAARMWDLLRLVCPLS